MPDDSPQSWLPNRMDLARILAEPADGILPELLDKALVGPAADLVGRPSKRLRAELVSIGAALGQPEGDGASQSALAACAAAVELLHAGSLIVDDIQDDSPVRRGGPTVHARYGLQGAICTGNWLYFWPMRLISDVHMPPDRELKALRLYQDAVERAHYGQALDVSVKATTRRQSEVQCLAQAVLELKTGAITELAMGLGAVAAGAKEDACGAIARFGRQFGFALQQLDDLGNVIGKYDAEKRREDLRCDKLSGVWHFIATHSDATAYATFKQAASAFVAGDEATFDRWIATERIESRVVDHVRQSFASHFNELSRALSIGFDNPAIKRLEQLMEVLIRAYF